MKTATRFDYPGLPAHSTFNVRLMLTLAGEGSETSQSTPLNIGLVIDTSGSMQGEKIAKVKEAAIMITRMLSASDIYSLVTFSDAARTIVPVAKGADLKGVEELINRITADGNTNLHGGYQKSFELVRDGSKFAASRVVLLSDGQANVGLTSIVDLGKFAASLRGSQVTTTTFGVGHDFDDALMTVIAEEGGGSANYIEHPRQAAEVFREELEDLRGTTASNTRIRFLPGSSVASCTLLNNFPEGDDGYLVGDVYATRERQMVLELAIKTGPETAGLTLGAFEVRYNVPGKGAAVPITLPVSLPVVSEKKFATYQHDKEVTLEAALLTVGRAKREAMRLADEQRFVEAADLLENFVAALAGLYLNDPELDRELDRLKERAWNLRHRGEEYYTAMEQKRFAYEADMTLKGKKEMYLAMMDRREPYRAVTTPDNMVTIYSGIENSLDLMIANAPDRTATTFLDEVFSKLDGAVEPETYGLSWVLRDRATSRIFDAGFSYALAEGEVDDRRTLHDIGIDRTSSLEAVSLPPLIPNVHAKIPKDVVRLDLSLIDPGRTRAMDLPYRPTAIACDFLAVVYGEIRQFVPPNTYGRIWLLRDVATGRVFDFGSAWARFNQLQADVRPLQRVGITGGTQLQAVLLSR